MAAAEPGFPEPRQVVLDSTDARALAEFYRQLLGLAYRPGDEPPAAGEPDPLGQDWLVLRDATGSVPCAISCTFGEVGRPVPMSRNWLMPASAAR